MTARLKSHIFRRLSSCLLAVAFLICLLPTAAYGAGELTASVLLAPDPLYCTYGTSETYQYWFEVANNTGRDLTNVSLIQ